MQRSGAATRRFYAAFYQLTVRSVNPTRPCVAGASLLVSTRAKSTTTRKSKRAATGISGRSIKPTTKANKRTDKRPQFPPKVNHQLQLKDFVGTTELLQDEPIQSSAERPFRSMEAWGHAIRGRSLNSVTVEIAVPDRVLHSKDVADHARAHDVKFSLPKQRRSEDYSRLRQVILSGNPIKVKEVWETMHHTTSLRATRHPSVPVSPPGLEPWTYVVKAGEAGKFEEDICLPESVWRPLAESGCVEWFEQEYHVQTDVRDTREGCTYLRLKGSKNLLWSLTRYLLKAERWTDRQARENHEFIRKTVSNEFASSLAPPSNEPRSKEGGPEMREALLTEYKPLQSTPPVLLEKPHLEETGPEGWRPKLHGPQPSTYAPVRSDTKVRMRRFFVPKRSQRVFEVDTSPIAQIQQDSGLQALRYRPMADSKYYLQLIGTISAIEAAIPMLEQVMVPNDDEGETRVNLERYYLTEDQFRPPRPTTFAWIKLPSEKIDMTTVMFELKHCLRWNDCDFQKFRRGGNRDLMVRGTKRAVRLAIIDLQNVIDQRRVKIGLPTAELEVYNKGDIQYIERDTPWTNPVITTDDQKQPGTASQDGEQKKTTLSSGAARELNKANMKLNRRLGEEVRSVLRHLTQPVALITSTMPGGCSDEAAKSSPRGVTVSSFCTVTLDPKPVISFNLRVPSRTWDAIERSKRLSVSLLAASPEGAAVAHAFASPYEDPHEPFARLENLGASVMTCTGDVNPPDITWREAVYTRISADLVSSKCVLVGDHMIVVARVSEIRDEETLTHPDYEADYGALAYGMRGYRSLGEKIEPMTGEAAKVGNVESTEGEEAPPELETVEPVEEKPEEALPQEQAQDPWKEYMEDFMEDTEKDDRKPAETQGSYASTDRTAHQEGQTSKDLQDIGPSSPIMDEESLRQVLWETEASYSTKGLPSQTANENPMLAEALKAAAGAYDESPDAATAPTASTPQKPVTTADSLSDTSQTKTPSDRSQNISHRPSRNFSNRSFSNRIPRHARRSYSTSNDPKSPTPEKILKSTVEDFLCQIPTNNRLYNNLIAAQRQAEKLEKLVANGKVVAEEIAQVEHESQAIRRRVARELAWRNAQDLRVLLDQGRVGPERAQWLETNLEQGQAVLLQEAKLLRTELEEGRLVKEEFEGTKAALMKDYEEFEGLLKRLRDFVDEDDVSAGEGQEQEPGSSGSGRP